MSDVFVFYFSIGIWTYTSLVLGRVHYIGYEFNASTIGAFVRGFVLCVLLWPIAPIACYILDNIDSDKNQNRNCP